MLYLTAFKNHKRLIVIFFVLLYIPVYSQDEVKDYTLSLQTGTYLPEICTEFSIKKQTARQYNLLSGKHPAILQFYDIPNTNQRTALKAAGVELQGYVPNYAYVSLIPQNMTSEELLALGVRAVVPIATKNKTDKTLLQLQKNTNTTHLPPSTFIIHTLDNIPAQKIIDELARQNIEVHFSNENKVLEATLNPAQIESLAAMPFVQYIERASETAKPLGTRSKSVKGNYLNSPFIGGLMGEGVTVGIGENGAAAHIDFVGRIINDVEEDYLQDDHHANLVGGMLGGAGVLRERVKGIAPKAQCIFDTGSQLMADSNIDEKVAQGMVLTNHSYGVTEGGEYSYFSRLTDNQQTRHPNLLHVFSVGNSGKMTMDGYPMGYNTVLAHGQSSKNSITAGGINHLNELYLSSSRGPTRDGRLKPELSAIAYGFLSPGSDNNYAGGYGTSFSAPQLTGGLALLYEHYRNLHGEDPEGGLMKAVVCNTAEDLGNPGPDFTYGFGKLNLRRAKALLDAENHYEGTVNHKQNTTQTINVPIGLSELKVMLYWTDTSATEGVTKQLVNDLDLQIISPNDNIYLPYVLDTNPDRVERDAVPFADRVNNIEQVVIKNPIPGTYTVRVRGHVIPYEAQKFHVSYEYVETGLFITAPVPGEVMPGGGSTNYYVEWDYNGPNDFDGDSQDERFTIDYTPDNGITWITLNDSIAASARIYKWEKHLLKGINSSNLWVRVTKNDTPYFTVVGAACKLYDFIGRREYEITPLCNDEILFEWQKIDDASFYEILRYDGGEEMQVVTSTTDTSLVYTYDYDNGKRWFSVRAVYPDNDQRSLCSDAKLFVPPIPTATASCPPSIPGNIDYQAGQYHVQFFWDPSTDDVDVTGYVIYENGIPIQTVNSTDYMVHNIQPGTNVQYCISAIDIHGNESQLNCFATSTFGEDFCNQDVLFISQNKILTDGESVIHDQLQSADYSIFTIDKNSLQNHLWDKNWTVVISPEAEIEADDRSLFDEVPLVVLNFNMLDDFNLSSGNISGTGSTMNILGLYHPLAAGQQEDVEYYIGDYHFKGAADISPDALPIVRHESNANILFAYEAGHTMMNNAVAPSKRVAYPIEYDHVESFSGEAWMFLNAGLAWAANCTPSPPSQVLNMDLSPDFTTITVEWETPSFADDIVRYAVYANDTMVGLTSANQYTISDLSPSTEYKISISALNIQYLESSRIYDYTTTLTCKDLEIYVWLEGALHLQENDSMRTDLVHRNMLPYQFDNQDALLENIGHPYSVEPWEYLGPETIETYEPNVVDWVLVSFRTSIAKTDEVFRMAGLLYADGRIRFPRNCVNHEFTAPVYLVIEHRNHIGIMSAMPLTIENHRLFYDFRNQDSYAISSTGQKEIKPGVWAMPAGDIDQKNDFGSYQITGADKIPWQVVNGIFRVYTNEDINLDGDVNGKDKTIWFENNGIYSTVPK